MTTVHITDSTSPPEGWRILGFGKHPDTAAAVQAHLRGQGLRARNFALTDDAEGDAALVGHLTDGEYDGILIGSYINGQNPSEPPTPDTTAWFNRILNITHLHAPTAKLILVRDPADALTTIENVLGPPGPAAPRTSGAGGAQPTGQEV
ncbi:hypothetical protein [Nakamurella deserti]|uniref:hypothetical protein n=1 Tax=Nakamurella deserti TaxID=2164074 RepID=UPI000DBE90B6|nr:hypothetical protein [Nakamurella deserti]